MTKPSRASIAVFGASAAFVLIAFGTLLYVERKNKSPAPVTMSSVATIACEAAILPSGQLGLVVGTAH